VIFIENDHKRGRPEGLEGHFWEEKGSFKKNGVKD
jgi:hypothetical protein